MHVADGCEQCLSKSDEIEPTPGTCRRRYEAAGQAVRTSLTTLKLPASIRSGGTPDAQSESGTGPLSSVGVPSLPPPATTHSESPSPLILPLSSASTYPCPPTIRLPTVPDAGCHSWIASHAVAHELSSNATWDCSKGTYMSVSPVIAHGLNAPPSSQPATTTTRGRYTPRRSPADTIHRQVRTCLFSHRGFVADESLSGDSRASSHDAPIPATSPALPAGTCDVRTRRISPSTVAARPSPEGIACARPVSNLGAFLLRAPPSSLRCSVRSAGRPCGRPHKVRRYGSCRCCGRTDAAFA